MKKKLQLDLADNARSFLVEALQKAVSAEGDTQQWKFAILHMVQAIELSLKELLRIQHPILVYSNVDKPGHTVTLELALSRLKRLTSFEPSSSERASLELAAKIRNDIVHHEFAADPAELKAAFSHLLGFLEEFHRDRLDYPLGDFVPRDLWIKGARIKDYGEELYKRAQSRMKADGIEEDMLIGCPKCGWPALTSFGDSSERCYVCSAVTDLVTCSRCQTTVISGEHEESMGKNYCRNCYEYISDDYWYETRAGK